MKTEEVFTEKLCKDFGSHKNTVRVLDNVCFTAGSCGITGVLGVNGAGKSTFLKTLCGLYLPTEGQVSVYGKTEPYEIRKLTGFASEDFDFDKSMTVKELLWFSSKSKESFSNAIQVSYLADVLEKKVKFLSKGFKQRLCFALALCKEPKLLVLDEFTDGLDVGHTLSVRNFVKDFALKNAVVLSTHNIREAEILCDKIYIMHRGKIAAEGTCQEILNITGQPDLENAFLCLTAD